MADIIDRPVGEGAEAATESSVEPQADTPAPTPHAHIEHETNTGISNTKLAMWLFLGSECLLFGGLITTYLLYKQPLCGQGPGPRDMICNGQFVKGVFDIPFTSVTSFCLLASSLTMVLAVSAIERGDHQRLRVWLAATAALGCVFISGQVYEFTAFKGEGLGYSTSRFSSAFYTLTGFHGVHVTIGIIMLVSMLLWSIRGNLPEHRAETVEIAGLYWHFVDVVWILIFAVVYLIP